jgi:hypothetical protein
MKLIYFKYHIIFNINAPVHSANCLKLMLWHSAPLLPIGSTPVLAFGIDSWEQDLKDY